MLLKKSTIPSPLTASQSQSDAIPSPALSLPPTMPSLHSVTPSLHTHSDLFLTSLFVPHRSRAQCSSGCMQQSLFPRPAPPLRDIFIFYPKKSWLLKTVTNTFAVSLHGTMTGLGNSECLHREINSPSSYLRQQQQRQQQLPGCNV